MIRFDHVRKVFPDGTVAVEDLSFDVNKGDVVTLVGPSGCGKTTTMKMVNRLIEPTGGTITVDGQDIMRTNAVELRRRIGYVIQNVGLFPHETVSANVATVPQLLGWDRKRIADRVAELLALVGLEAHANRYPAQLSGGQRQRVGVARALAADPPVLLMDEPFGAVDPIVRERLQGEFLRLMQEVRKTVLFVTHDLDEAVLLGDKVAVFSQGGKLEQYDAPATILGAPATPFVADFVGTDRGLKRLSVTPIDVADLEHPPVVHLTDRLADATASLRASGARWAVVLDNSDALHGWISADGADGADPDETVSSRAQRMEAWVPVGASLKRAFSEMLQHDAGWVAVLEGDRFLGVLTPAALHEALRRSVESEARGLARDEVDLDSISRI
ncbi:MAG: ATP-binding cassette domain-containing protein [Sporichthyaceae bacterium]